MHTFTPSQRNFAYVYATYSIFERIRVGQGICACLGNLPYDQLQHLYPELFLFMEDGRFWDRHTAEDNKARLLGLAFMIAMTE